ncbi:FAD-binding and (Fe-S)-binding domain-containing protein, partial [Streptomyces hainanensis]
MTTTSTRALDRLAAAHDASHYLLVPAEVATPRDVGEVAALLRSATERGLPLTFRSGGTSLSGQGVTDGLLADTRRHFRHVEVLDDGARVRAQPGATVRQVNARLARHGRKLGPDPASEIACTVGGVVANNSSGMACGTEHNTYRTLDSLVAVLPSGTVVDTGAPDADARLRAAEPELYAGLAALRDRVRGNPESVRVIRRQFAIKNTMGYGVNAYLDHDEPADILAHLLIGSEGTLGFVAEATFRTVAALPHAATGLAVFPTLAAATAALPALTGAGLATIELMDATSLRLAQAERDPAAALAALPPVAEHAAFLVEFLGADEAAVAAARAAAEPLLADLDVVAPLALTGDARERAALWQVRKGLYTMVAGARPAGTTALLEDIAVPVPALLDTCERLTALFAEHGYPESVIFGHAKDGNIHFMLSERFEEPAALDRYRRFTDDLVDLVLGNDGTLKAEHGTGRIMAPFVRRQYGDELYEVMRETKRLCDPAGVLNPGVVLTDRADAHLRDIKRAPAVEEEVDRCVECGFCEPACPSRDLTLTPRQRIALRREARAAEEAGDTALLAELERDYAYDGVDTCAVDGMCQVACPVRINTGDLVRRLRAERPRPLERAGWNLAAGHWAGAARAGGAALSLAAALPTPLATAATAAGRALLGADTVPAHHPGLPGGGDRRRPRAAERPVAVYVPSCTGAVFGPGDGGDGVTAAFLELCDRAGVQVTVPEGIDAMCCGTPWKSKGHDRGHRRMADRVRPALWAATREGELPVVSDAASCTEGLAGLLDELPGPVRVVDAVAFVHDTLLDRLTVTAPLPSLA